MDGIIAYALAPELNDMLQGSFVERIAMEDRHRLTLTLFSSDRRKHYLTLSANPTTPYLALSQQSPPRGMNPPPAFAMYLRKHLRRAKLLKVTSPDWERVFVFQLIALDELGDERELQLIFECMPRTANIVLINRDAVIMAAIRHVDHRVNRVREILPAHPYVPPPPQNRKTVPEILQMTTESFFSDLDQNTPSGWAVTRSIGGFSPLLGDEVAKRAGIDAAIPLGALDRDAQGAFFREAQALCQSIVANDFRPAIYYDAPEGEARRRPIAVHAVPLTQFHHARYFDTLYEALFIYNTATATLEHFLRGQQALQKKLSDRIKHARKKRKLHEDDLAEGEEAELDRLKGELILAYIHAIPAGAEQIALDNYYAPGEKVICALDPTRTAAENANRYFAKSKRKKRKWEAAQSLLADDLDRLAWLESLLTTLRFADTQEDLDAVRQELESDDRQANVKVDSPGSQGMPGRPASKKRRQQQSFMQNKKAGAKKDAGRDDKPLSPRKFRSSEGYTLASGRNNLQNDQLLRKAARADLWFHVKDQPGSHVLVASQGQEIPEQTILEAAGIAAWYSGAGRTGVAVEVDYCAVRDVKKIPASRPGNVSYKNYKTLYVNPLDPKVLESF